MAKLVYRPFGHLFSVLGGVLATTLFKQIWKRVAGKDDPPKAKESEYGWREILPAAVLQGALFGLVRPRSTGAVPGPSRRSPVPGRATSGR